MPPFPYGMPPVLPALDVVDFAVQLVYALVALALCYAIFRKTRESYELTKHEGLYCFRQAFLLFGLSYLARFLFTLSMLSRDVFGMFMLGRAIAPVFIFLMGFFSTLAIFYLLLGSFWKKYEGRNALLYVAIAAAVLAIISSATRSSLALLALQSVILVAAAALLVARKEKITAMKAMYLLVFATWIVNLWTADLAFARDFELKLLLQLLSLVGFAAVYLRVSKWIK